MIWLLLLGWLSLIAVVVIAIIIYDTKGFTQTKKSNNKYTIRAEKYFDDSRREF